MSQEWITPIPKAVCFTKGVGKHKYRPQSLELAMLIVRKSGGMG